MARATISLVSVQKPTANTPVLQRRNKFTSSIDQQITKVGLFRMLMALSTFNSGMANSRWSWRRARAR